MADKIRLSASEASSAVRTIKNKAQEAQNMVNHLQRDIQNVKTWWEGDAAAAFVDEFEKSKKEFNKMIECIHKYGEMLTKAIEIQQKADADVARQMRS